MEIATEVEEKPQQTPEMQEARSFLRERFLRFMVAINEKPAVFHMHEKTKVQGQICGSDVDVLHIFVKDLQTPLGKQPVALLRTSDILRVQILK